LQSTGTGTDTGTDTGGETDTGGGTDNTAPTASVTAVTITSSENATVRSTETGTAYLVNTDVTVNNNLVNINGAYDNQTNSVAIILANIDTNLPATGLADGTYKVYAVDVAGNLSSASSNSVIVVTTVTDTTTPTVSFSPANGAPGVAISDNITITFSEAVRNIDNTVLTNSNSGDANGVGSLITLRLNNTYPINIAFYATIDTNKTVITIDPTNNLPHSQAVYDNSITAANATFTTTMDPSLEAFYPFNGNANDESENSYHGQLGDNVTTSKFPTLTTDRYDNEDKAFSFDGNDYIALDKYVTPNSISEITVCAWVLSTDNTSNKFIISFDRSESYRLALNDGGNTYVGWDTTDSENNTDDLRTLDSYEDGNWHHICGWYNSSSTEDKKIFVDGVKEAFDNNSHSGINLGTSLRSNHYGFIGWGSEASSFDGNASNAHQNDFMIGKIDDVRIYSRSLSDEEIRALYLREQP